MEESESGGDSRWGNLPPVLIFSIFKRVALPDVFRARGVCRRWAQVLRNPSSLPAAATFPFLILSSEQGELAESCTLLSLTECRCYRLSPLPEIRNRRFIGSNGNWLVTLNLSLDPRLLNPFTREESPLPSLISIPERKYRRMCTPLKSISTWVGFYYPSNRDEAQQSSPIPYPINLFRDLCIRKIVPSSSDENGPPAVVLVAYGLGRNVRLALARPGYCAWTLVPLPLSVKIDGVSDVVHNANDGRFYAVTKSEMVLAFHPDNPEHVSIISEGDTYSWDEKKYLIFSSDDLLMVERHQGLIIKRNKCSDAFHVYKINIQREEGDFTFTLTTRMKHLSGRCLMLGSNHSVSLSPEQVPGLKGNCIYFTDDSPDDLSKHYRDHPRDVGVFDMELGTIDRFLTDYSSYTWPPPIWFLPSLHMY